VNPGRILEFYKESEPLSVMSVVQVSNNFYTRGLWNAAQWMQHQLPVKIKRLIPTVRIDSGAFGWVSASGFSPPARCRWNEDLQRQEYQTLGIRSKSSGSRHEGFANLLQFFTEQPSDSQLSSWSSGEFAKTTLSLTRQWVPVE
jgi:hypothetical protein